MKEKEVKVEDETDTSDISTDPEWADEIENKPEAGRPQEMEIDSIIPGASAITQSVVSQEKVMEIKKTFRKTVHVPVNRSKKVEVGPSFIIIQRSQLIIIIIYPLFMRMTIENDDEIN